MNLVHAYEFGQFDLAVLDTMCGDYAEYGHCLSFAIRSSAIEAVLQMHAMNGALAFEDCERETRDERLDRWVGGDEQRRAA